MTPAARLSAAIEILDLYGERQAAPSGARLEPILARWGRENRYAGSKDRAAIGDRAHDCVRRWQSYGAAMGETGRGRVLASLIAEGLSPSQVEALFTGEGHAPSPLTAEERAALAKTPAPASDWPDWLLPELERSVADPEAEIEALSRRAAADLRVNSLKATVEEARAALGAEGVEADPAPLSPIGLRLVAPRRLGGLAAFRDGLVEPQDAASQAVALLGAAALREHEKPLALDYCAGGGGKALALAAALGGRGDVIAHDVAPERMADIPERARRAGARIDIARTPRDLEGCENRCDLVFVDAPCSGSGAWARHPDEKWRLTPERLAAVRAAQRDALITAARYVCAGGFLLYATCSLLACENRDQADWFLGRGGHFQPEPLAAHWGAAGIMAAAPEGCAAAFTPAVHGADGFFLALFRCAG